MEREDKIRLFELLGEYANELKYGKKTYMECKDKQELAAQMLLCRNLAAIEDLQTTLSFEF